MNAETRHHRRPVLQTHGREVEAVGSHEIRRLRQVFRSCNHTDIVRIDMRPSRVGTEEICTFDQIASAHDVSVRMIYGHVETERLQQDVLVED